MSIQIKNLEKRYGNHKALKGVSFEIQLGKIFGLLGPNGSGKTTFSSILATRISKTGGDVLYNGASIYKDVNAFRRIIGFCPQKPNLNNQLSVRKNLFYDALYYGLGKKRAQENFERLTHDLSLTEYLDAKPDILSGGYKQRVMIARALMHDPSIIILDEPTVGLDPHIRRQLWHIIKNLNTTTILTTHYLEEADALSDCLCILDKGQVLLVDTPKKLKEKHNEQNLEDIFVHLMEEEALR